MPTDDTNSTTPGARRSTLREVASEAGVSTATVSRTIKEPSLVDPATRHRVMEVVTRLGYMPNPSASNLRRGTSGGVMGLVTAGYNNKFQTGIAAGAERALRESGHTLLIASTDDAPSREIEVTQAMIKRRVDALLLMPDGDERGHLEAKSVFGTPVVLIGRPRHELACDLVTTADDVAVTEAVTQLIELGHHRVAALAGRRATYRAQQRLSGFEEGLARGGLQADPKLIISELDSPGKVRSAIARLMDLDNPPTALMALNLGITEAALADRIMTGRRNAFVGWDDFPLAEALGITVIARDAEELGSDAALQALARLSGDEDEWHTIVRPCRLIQRGSGEIPA